MRKIFLCVCAQCICQNVLKAAKMHLAETERLLVLSIPSTVTGAAKRRAQGQRQQT